MLVYGPAVLAKAIEEAQVKHLFLTPKRKAGFDQSACDSIGCKVTVIGATELMRMLGGAVGIRWYNSAGL
jgi:hypothetical protein